MLIGRLLSQFKIEEKLGEGGMGEVYRALDTNLDRPVAIKVLPEEFTSDPERLARFEHEAKVLASLNHPSIVTIHELSQAVPRLRQDSSLAVERGDPRAGETEPNGSSIDAIYFLVMELVEGWTLDEEIPDGGLPLDRFLDLAIPLADTLAAAHRQGIIHRDLKPSNIMLTTSGSIKVLDFGLAKRRLAPDQADDGTPTESLKQLTRENQILGTGPYLSPEQVRSGPLDERSDLFSLGVVMFEMLTATRPFSGETSIDLVTSILRDEPPDLRDLRPDLPSSLIAPIRQCLEKDRAARISSAVELSKCLISIRKATSSDEIDSARSLEPSKASGAAELQQRAIAVLPFATLSGDEDTEFLATGLHNDVITELSRIRGLTVISRTSVMSYRDTTKSLKQIGRELNVGTIVEGTVQSAANRVRLTAQLIDASVDVQRWAERYDRDLSTETLFDLQTEVTRKIVDSLQTELAPVLEIPAGKLQTHDMEVYRLCTLGQVQLDRRTEAGCRRAVEHFQTAVEQEPGYAPAWAGLAGGLAFSIWYGYVESSGRLERAEVAARRAIDLDPESAAAHCSLGAFLGARRDGPAALKQLEVAIRLQPSYSEAHSLLSYLYNLHGRAGESLVAAKRSVEVNPLSAEAVNHLALSLLTTGDGAQALSEARRAAELSPGWKTAAFYEALSLYELGRYEEVIALLSGLAIEWAGLGAQSTLALAHIAAGQENLARETLAIMDSDLDAFAVGLVHLGLGEIESAFDSFSTVGYLSDWACLVIHHFYPSLWAPVAADDRYLLLVSRAFKTHNLGPAGRRIDD